MDTNNIDAGKKKNNVRTSSWERLTTTKSKDNLSNKQKNSNRTSFEKLNITYKNNKKKD